jgi:hypothetical protein
VLNILKKIWLRDYMGKPQTAIIVGIILVIAGLVVLFAYRPLTSTTAQELCDDWDLMTATFDSYDSGETVTIVDEIYDMQYMDTHLGTGEPIEWTMIGFKSAEVEVEDLLTLMDDPSKLWGFIIFNGDLTDKYEEGDKVEVKVKVVDFTLLGLSVEILDWYEDIMDAVMEADDPDLISYGDLEFADESNISHANLIPEIMGGGIFIVGLILLIVGFVQLSRAKKERPLRAPPSPPPPYGTGVTGPQAIPPPPPPAQPGYPHSPQWQQQAPQPPPPQPPPVVTPIAERVDIESITCPKCGNVMDVKVPYRPFECFCDKCGVKGIIR